MAERIIILFLSVAFIVQGILTIKHKRFGTQEGGFRHFQISGHWAAAIGIIFVLIGLVFLFVGILGKQ